MKIAIVTDDGITVSDHFGRARYYAVLTMDGPQVVRREMIDRSETLPPVDEHQPRQGMSGQIDCHGTGTAAAATHLRMVQPIKECQALLAGGMSWSARECLLDAGVRPIITDISGLDEAVQAYMEGTILDHVEKLH
ncbi:MAG TPA: NifB/NifX family molybdenum-iron cluster-binding protein [Anaerolineae bacterium]|nr:NifB/NifX family molybdenum-iron cluster-binding protein [Anaerolineae bacterium]